MSDTEKKKILIINYDFPPNPGIGGRRWAIFAKYLTALGFQVHVLMKKPAPGSYSDFDVYVRNIPDLHRHYLPVFYPRALVGNPESLPEKLKYRFWQFLMRLISRGTPYDKTILWSVLIRSKIRNVAQAIKPEAVIVSGAPFRLCYYTALEKNNLKALLLTDFRDPWTWGKGYGYGALNDSRKRHESKMEQITVTQSDLVTIPVNVMRQHLIDKYPHLNNKFHVLPHGYDSEIILHNNGNRFKEGDTLRLVHYGTINDFIEEEMTSLAKLIKEKQGKITLTFYSKSNKYSTIFKKYDILNKYVFYKGSIPHEELFRTINLYDFSMIIHPEAGKNNLSTKIYETVYSGTPIMYIGLEGEISEFLKNTHSGVHIKPDCIEEEINQARLSDCFTFERTLVIDQFSYKNITDKLVDILRHSSV